MKVHLEHDSVSGKYLIYESSSLIATCDLEIDAMCITRMINENKPLWDYLNKSDTDEAKKLKAILKGIKIDVSPKKEEIKPIVERLKYIPISKQLARIHKKCLGFSKLGKFPQWIIRLFYFYIENITWLNMNKKILEIEGSQIGRKTPETELTTPNRKRSVRAHGFAYGKFVDNKTCELFYLAVDPQFQRRKVASKLISNFLYQAKIKGADKVVAYVHYWNTPAIKFYDKNGGHIEEHGKRYRVTWRVA